MQDIQKALKALYKTVPGKRRSCRVRAKATREARAAMSSFRSYGPSTKHCFTSARQFRDMRSRLGEYTDWLELDAPCVQGFEVEAMVKLAEEALERDCGGDLAGRRTRRKVRR